VNCKFSTRGAGRGQMRHPILAFLIVTALLAPAAAQTGAQGITGLGPGLPQTPARPVPLRLSAFFANTQVPVRAGLQWRVYADQTDGTQTLAARSSDAAPTFSLTPGNYTVHAAYGFASAVKRIVLSDTTIERLSIGAGAIRIMGTIGDTPIPPARLNFSVYVPVNNNSEGSLVIANAKGGDVIRLPEGNYHVVSNYGDSNAIVRADLKVEIGKITDATLNHRAATVTLKLVRSAGGEAFAGTAFSVLTPGGDVVREAIGAFPSFVLAEGDYVVIARHEGQVYTREFKVTPGLDRDIEVSAKQ
jgi:hypothetical protein